SVRCDYSNALREISGTEITAPVLSRVFLDAICEKSAQGQMYLDHVHFNLGYGTEWDLAHRAKIKGFKIGVCHNANFYHISHQSIKNSVEYKHSEHVYATEAWKEQKTGFLKKYGKNVVNEVAPKEKPNLNQRYGVYTTCFGGYDTLKEIPPQSVDIDWYVVCDRQPNFENEKAKKQWNVVLMDYPRIGNDRLNAKFFKLYPRECQELLAHDYLIYIDLSIRIKSRDFVRYILSNLSNKHFTIYKHPSGRTTIEQELMSSLHPSVAQKYKHLPIKKQVEFYRQFRKIPLAACGVFVRSPKNQKINKIFNEWWWEIIKWSYQDQLSFPVICAINNFLPEWFPENQSQNPYHETEWCSKP
ncbi:MAG: hypothetical protein Q8K92_26420, partial [Leadbetterella sp.]|nr:hypothetical protein [Leadbetterella sp.]